MGTISRNHHYIPQFYLKGFRDDSNPQLFVLDRKNPKPFFTNPINFGCERDFNRLNIKGTLPDDLEKKLSKLIVLPVTNL
jgi:Protein of unknown function (DUF4238)